MVGRGLHLRLDAGRVLLRLVHHRCVQPTDFGLASHDIASWVRWFNHERLHSSIGDVPPAELEQSHYDSTRGHDAPVAA